MYCTWLSFVIAQDARIHRESCVCTETSSNWGLKDEMGYGGPPGEGLRLKHCI